MDINNINNAQCEPYVFISYSTRNQTVADSVRNMFIEDGVENWMAPYDIPAGFKYAHVIDEAVKNCECVLLLLTNDSQNSQHVEREVERAVTYKKSIITMKLEDLELNPGFSYFLGTTQVVAVREIDKNNPEMKKILDAIYAYVKPQKKPGTKPGDKSGLTLKEQLTLFLPSITKEDFDDAKAYVEEHPDEVIAGGVFWMFAQAFALGEFNDKEMKQAKTSYNIWKILYRLAYVKGYEKICDGMKKITLDDYIDANASITRIEMEEMRGKLSREIYNMIIDSKVRSDVYSFETLLIREFAIMRLLFEKDN